MSDYPEQPWPDLGKFTCQSCLTEFPKADPQHGASGFCAQCEIARGMILLHGDNKEANEQEQRATRSVIAYYVLAFSGLKP